MSQLFILRRGHGNATIWTDNTSGAPGRNRTYDLRIRKPLLYPTELQGQLVTLSILPAQSPEHHASKLRNISRDEMTLI